MAPSGSEYASEGAESRGYAGETEATRSPGALSSAGKHICMHIFFIPSSTDGNGAPREQKLIEGTLDRGGLAFAWKIGQAWSRQQRQGVRRANSVQAASARPPPPASNQSPSAQLADQGGLSMAPSQADPTYAPPGATRDDRAGPGYSAPAAREERPMRQVTPYGQAAMPPAAPGTFPAASSRGGGR
ncbi:UNVERIFIED_CONTAM: hypothetical protein K2H54_004402 [Gekko kuhli]